MGRRHRYFSFYHVKLENEIGKISKRKILSKISQVYDPLGWVGLIIVKAKIMLQHLWRLNCGWDDVVNEARSKMWTQWITQIHCLQDLIIPRRISCNDPIIIEITDFAMSRK